MMKPLAEPTKCRCATFSRIALAKKTLKALVKQLEVLGSKPHPANPAYFRGTPTFISLFRCKVCGQHWQVDRWSRTKVGYTSWPELCIKLDTAERWESFEDRELRLQYFPQMKNGLSVQKCSTPKCNDLAINGLSLCADCACIKLHCQTPNERKLRSTP